jgi:lipid-binding SYLF domain-containing protein
MRKLIVIFLLAGLSSFAWAAQTKTDVEERLQDAAKTLRSIESMPENGIPNEVIKGAKCVAVVPSMLKGGFILGGRHGRGVATCKLPDGKWSAPEFFTVSGGSWGAQIGVEDIQLVMMIMNDEGMRHLISDKFKIGGQVSAAAGPIGREASASTGWKLNSEILTYSRAKGLFAGADLGGTEVEKDGDSTTAYYGKDYSTKAILDGHVKAPHSSQVFLSAVRRDKTEARTNASNTHHNDSNNQ